MRKHLILALLISLLMSGVTFGETDAVELGSVGMGATVDDGGLLPIDAYAEDTDYDYTFSVENVEVLRISGFQSSARLRITVTFPDGSQKIVIWDTEDKPLKIEMEPLSDEDYIKELEMKIDALEIHPYDVAPGEVIDVPAK